jgi:acetylornithine deacetylase/succinyl-diaminopimelate desuccinylase-like protein
VSFGADDNASGIAVLLELARVLVRSDPLDRTVVFVAFAGEEAGRRGSRHYVAAQKRFPADRAVGMVNLDTVGRLGNNPLFALGTGSAREWAHLLTGSGHLAGVAVTPVADDYGSSDQRSLDAGVPAVQLFSGPNEDYHKPSDTPDKIDSEGLIKVAAMVKEAVVYLATRERPLTAALSEKGGQGGTSSTERRSVSLGTIPDFAYAGLGVRLSGTLPGSPAARAGLRSGDVIVQLNSAPIRSLLFVTDSVDEMS